MKVTPTCAAAALAAAATAALFGAFAHPAAAQDAPQETQQAAKGTVIKGRAPVSKDLLKVAFPHPKEYTLSNGLRLLVLEDHRLPAIHATFLIKAGSLYETKKGVASLTGAMLDEGTTLRSKSDIDGIVQSLGASLNAGAGELYASISVAGLTDQTDRLLDLLVDVALHPSFPQERFDRLKILRIESLQRPRTDPNALGNELESRTLYGDTRYVRIPNTVEQIRAITRDDLVDWYGRYYRPNHALLGITGDVDGDTLAARLERLLAGWKPGGDDPVLPPSDKITPKAATHIFVIDRPGSKQTLLDFSNIGLDRKNPDYPALVVADHILGGGGSGRLFQNLREEKGYTYGAYSTLSAPRWPGIWGAYASVRNEVTGQAAGEFFKEFARIQKEPVSEDELARAKRSIIGSFARTLESTDSILGRSLEIQQYDLPADYWEDYARRIQTVTAADVQRVARKYLGENRIQLFAVGERSTLENALKPYGPVTVYDMNLKEVTGTP